MVGLGSMSGGLVPLDEFQGVCTFMTAGFPHDFHALVVGQVDKACTHEPGYLGGGEELLSRGWVDALRAWTSVS